MGKRSFKRRSKSREETFERRKPKYYFLIVTNGESTEFNYFSDYSDSLPKGTVRLEPVFENGSPTAVVEKALKYQRRGKYDEVWAVFDKDEFSDFDSAVAKADGSKISAGYSNPSFELWVLIHFQDVTTGLDRTACLKKVEEYLQRCSPAFKYNKSKAQPIFSLLEQHGSHEAARRRARKMEVDAGYQPWKTNPSTAIHLLIDRITEELGNC